MCVHERRCKSVRNESTQENEGGGGGGGGGVASVQPELNPFGSVLCLAFCLTALKPHVSQPHKLTLPIICALILQRRVRSRVGVSELEGLRVSGNWPFCLLAPVNPRSRLLVQWSKRDTSRARTLSLAVVSSWRLHTLFMAL